MIINSHKFSHEKNIQTTKNSKNVASASCKNFQKDCKDVESSQEIQEIFSPSLTPLSAAPSTINVEEVKVKFSPQSLFLAPASFQCFFSFDIFAKELLKNPGPLLALDWGKKNSGLALSDDSWTGAFPLDIVPSGHALRYALKDHWHHYGIKGLVIGFPKDYPFLTKPILSLAERLYKDHGWAILLFEEYYTSQDARGILSSIFSLELSSKNKKNFSSRHQKRNNKIYKIDHHSATLLLQEILPMIHHYKNRHYTIEKE